MDTLCVCTHPEWMHPGRLGCLAASEPGEPAPYADNCQRFCVAEESDDDKAGR
jgi:hypothetical protein